MRYRHILLMAVVLLTGCGCQSDLKKVLSYSGENRSNLQTVLDHYAQSDSTKLQYQAARFLIENMGSHYSWLGENMQSFILQVDSMYPNMPNSIRRVVYGLPQRLALWDEGMEKARNPRLKDKMLSFQAADIKTSLKTNDMGRYAVQLPPFYGFVEYKLELYSLDGDNPKYYLSFRDDFNERS